MDSLPKCDLVNKSGPVDASKLMSCSRRPYLLPVLSNEEWKRNRKWREVTEIGSHKQSGKTSDLLKACDEACFHGYMVKAMNFRSLNYLVLIKSLLLTLDFSTHFRFSEGLFNFNQWQANQETDKTRNQLYTQTIIAYLKRQEHAASMTHQKHYSRDQVRTSITCVSQSEPQSRYWSATNAKTKKKSSNTDTYAKESRAEHWPPRPLHSTTNFKPFSTTIQSSHMCKIWRSLHKDVKDISLSLNADRQIRIWKFTINNLNCNCNRTIWLLGIKLLDARTSYVMFFG